MDFGGFYEFVRLFEISFFGFGDVFLGVMLSFFVFFYVFLTALAWVFSRFELSGLFERFVSWNFLLGSLGGSLVCAN